MSAKDVREDATGGPEIKDRVSMERKTADYWTMRETARSLSGTSP